MASYKTLSLIQSIFIFILAISLFDFGVNLARAFSTEDELKIINDFLFSDSESEYWTIYTFWAYNIFAGGIVQILKAFSK